MRSRKWPPRGTGHLAMLAIALAAILAAERAVVGQQTDSPPAITIDAAAGAADGPPHTVPTRNLLQIVQDGGWLMYPILICSFLTVVFALERWIALRGSRVVPGPFVRRFLDQVRSGALDQEHALILCEENGSPVAAVFAAAVKRWGRPAVEIEQAVLDQGERTVSELRRHVRVFNAVATVSPLLGLLGTVFGMIDAFNNFVLASERGQPELLATGISVALLTTAAGLSVAIPALIVYLYFVARVDRLIMQIDGLGQEVVESISAEGQAAPRRAAGPRAGRRTATNPTAATS